MAQHQDPNGYLSGDKVRIRSGEYAGARGVVRSEASGLIEVVLNTGEILRARLEEITNYSLAARRAWQVMPKRAGRPKQEASSRKKMVSMRLDPDVWERLGEAVERGLIPNREMAIDSWIREWLEKIMPNT